MWPLLTGVVPLGTSCALLQDGVHRLRSCRWALFWQSLPGLLALLFHFKTNWGFFFTINSAYAMIWHSCYWTMVSLFPTVLVLNFLHHCCSPPPSQLTQLVLMCLFEILWDVGKEKTKDKMIGAALLTLLFVPCFRSEMSWLTLLFFLLLHLLSLLS